MEHLSDDILYFLGVKINVHKTCTEYYHNLVEFRYTNTCRRRINAQIMSKLHLL